MGSNLQMALGCWPDSSLPWVKMSYPSPQNLRGIVLIMGYLPKERTQSDIKLKFFERLHMTPGKSDVKTLISKFNLN